METNLSNKKKKIKREMGGDGYWEHEMLYCLKLWAYLLGDLSGRQTVL